MRLQLSQITADSTHDFQTLPVDFEASHVLVFVVNYGTVLGYLVPCASLIIIHDRISRIPDPNWPYPTILAKTWIIDLLLLADKIDEKVQKLLFPVFGSWQ